MNKNSREGNAIFVETKSSLGKNPRNRRDAFRRSRSSFRDGWKRICGGGRVQKDLYPLLSHSRLLLETAFVEFSARMETKWRETGRPLGPLGSFSPFLFPQTSCCRIAPVHLRLDPRPGKKRGGPVDKGILGWDEVSGRPQLSVMIASSRGPF